MRQSKLFTKTTKEAPRDEVSINAQLLIRAGFIDKLMAGVYTILPLGLRVIKKIENIIREEMDSVGGQEIFMPAFQPKENWIKTGRWDTMDDLYKVTDVSGREMALGPTHEEVVVPLMERFVNSYKDIPFAVYQFQNKFRMEMRSKSGILRGREFIMKDLYSFHLDEADLDAYYEKIADVYKKIFERAGIGGQTYKTFASGGSFSKYSHEFQTVTLAGEDIIYICNQCGLAVNKEIKPEVVKCPGCGADDYREEKAIEVGNIFKLMNKYTKPFGLKVKDEKGEDKEVIMGCYGIGLGRLMGTIVETYYDDRGIIWPEEVAPFKAHLIQLKSKLPAVKEAADKLYADLIKAGVEVLLDDREIGAGEKFADADLIGCPYRIVISEKTLAAESVEIKKRKEEKSELVKLDKIIEILK